VSNTKSYSYLIGNVVFDPETRPTRAGDSLRIRLAVEKGWTKEDGDLGADFYDVTIFNDGLRARAKSEIYKGARGVAVTGWLEKGEYNGKPQWSLIADRVGLTEFFAASKKGASVPAPAPVESDEFANV
jgi:single-stranded DNA-binding protein